MSLHEMTLRDKEPQPFTSCGAAIAYKKHERDEIDILMDQYLRKGGSIKVLGKTVDAIAEPIPGPQRKAKGKTTRSFDNTPITMVPYKNRALKRSIHGQNIRARSDGSYWVSVGAVDLGKHERWTKEQAIEVRDSYRKANGLPPVDY